MAKKKEQVTLRLSKKTIRELQLIARSRGVDFSKLVRKELKSFLAQYKNHHRIFHTDPGV